MKLTEEQINLIVERYFAWENPVEKYGWPGSFIYFYNPMDGVEIRLGKISILYGKHKLPENMRKERLKREFIKRINYEEDTYWLHSALEFLKGLVK